MTDTHAGRVDELANGAIDGELDADGQDELCRLLDDVEMIPRLRELFLLEAALRARSSAPHVVPAVLEQIGLRQQREQAQVLAAVMTGVRARPSRAATQRGSWLVRVAIAVAATAAMASLAVLVLRSKRERPVMVDDTRTPGFEAPGSERSSAQGPELLAPPPASTAFSEPQASQAEIEVFAFDFEDGVLPSIFTQGHVVAATALGGYVVQGTFNPWAPKRSSILINQPSGLFTYQPTMVLGFKYFLAEGTTDLRIQIYDLDQQQNYQWSDSSPRRDAWHSVAVRLADFHAVNDKGRKLAIGDRIQNITVMGGLVTAMPFLMDDVVLGTRSVNR